jgi:hypothetical protein
MEFILGKLHDAVKAKTKTETHVVAVDFVKSLNKLHVYKYGDSTKPKFTRTDITKRNSRVYEYITSTLADSSIAKDMCVGINPEYAEGSIQEVELGIFVFGMRERKKKQTLNLFKEFHGFMTCSVNGDTLKIDLICAKLRGLGTLLMKTIFGYATHYNYQRIELEAATDLLACFYYPRFKFKLLKPEDEANKTKICKERRRLRSDSELFALVRKLKDKMYPMVLKLETYTTKLRSKEPAEAAVAEEEVEAVAEEEVEVAAEEEEKEVLYLNYLDEGNRLLRIKKLAKGKSDEDLDKLEAAAAAAAAAEAAEAAAAALAEALAAAAAGGPAANGSGRTRKRKRSLKKNKKGGKNKTKRLKRKVGRNTRKKRNNVH